VRRPASREGVTQCAVIRGKITEFLDVEGIIAKANPPFVGGRAADVGEET
jgi:hypothetical protein